MDKNRYRVRAVQCEYRADDETVYAALKRATAPLTSAWARLGDARRIAIKFNQDNPPDQVVLYEGRRQQLVCDTVVRATLRLLREKTDAELFCPDISLYVLYFGKGRTTNILHLLDEFGVDYVDGGFPPHCMCATPRGGTMFRQYTMMKDVVDADALVSVAKAKNHYFTGVTGCLKNLFGILPAEPYGRPRTYYHHFVRLPYTLADIAMILNPALNIVDAMIAQAAAEWGDGKDTTRIMNTLIAGDHVVPTDACMMHLMGHDPGGDWAAPPFHRGRNPIVIAGEQGFGTTDLAEIDFESETAPQPRGTFYAELTDSPETNLAWMRTTSEQALHYRDNPGQFEKYRGEYILLQDGEVRWHSADGSFKKSRRALSGNKPDHAMWFKYVDPEETEGEHYEVYEDILRRADRIGG